MNSSPKTDGEPLLISVITMADVKMAQADLLAFFVATGEVGHRLAPLLSAKEASLRAEAVAGVAKSPEPPEPEPEPPEPSVAPLGVGDVMRDGRVVMAVDGDTAWTFGLGGHYYSFATAAVLEKRDKLAEIKERDAVWCQDEPWTVYRVSPAADGLYGLCKHHHGGDGDCEIDAWRHEISLIRPPEVQS